MSAAAEEDHHSPAAVLSAGRSPPSGEWRPARTAGVAGAVGGVGAAGRPLVTRSAGCRARTRTVGRWRPCRRCGPGGSDRPRRPAGVRALHRRRTSSPPSAPSLAPPAHGPEWPLRPAHPRPRPGPTAAAARLSGQRAQGQTGVGHTPGGRGLNWGQVTRSGGKGFNRGQVTRQVTES